MIPVILGLFSHLVNLGGNDNWGVGRVVCGGGLPPKLVQHHLSFLTDHSRLPIVNRLCSTWLLWSRFKMLEHARRRAPFPSLSSLWVGQNLLMFQTHVSIKPLPVHFWAAPTDSSTEVAVKQYVYCRWRCGQVPNLFFESSCFWQMWIWNHLKVNHTNIF